MHSLIKTLTALDLSRNQIGDNGVQHLANALLNNTVKFFFCFHFHNFDLRIFKQTLIDLNIADNNIGNESVQYLIDGLQNNRVNRFLFFIFLIFMSTFSTDADRA